MDIAFHSRSLRDICESEEMLNQHFGKQVGDSVKRRLADLRAAVSITDLVIGNLHELRNELRTTLCLDLSEGYSLLFAANYVKAPIGANNRVNWSAVTRVKVMSIEKRDD